MRPKPTMANLIVSLSPGHISSKSALKIDSAPQSRVLISVFLRVNLMFHLRKTLTVLGYSIYVQIEFALHNLDHLSRN